MLTNSLLLVLPLVASTQSGADPADKELQFKIARTIAQLWPALPFKQEQIHYRIYRSEKLVLVTISSDSQPESFLLSNSETSPLLTLRASLPSKALTTELLFNGVTYRLASYWSGRSPIFD